MPRSLPALLATAALAACGGDSSPIEPDPFGSCANGPSATRVAASVVAAGLGDVRANAAPGVSQVTIDGASPRSLSPGRSSALEARRLIGFTVLDAFVVDAERRPTAELFVFMRAPASVTRSSLVPVQVADLQSPGYVPSGTIAAYGEQFDATAGDYTRWFVGQVGCLAVTRVDTGAVGRVQARLTMRGTWQDLQGRSLGDGKLTANFEAPLIRLGGSTGQLRDTLDGAIASPRAGATVIGPGAGNFAAFQVLRAEQTRLAVVGVPVSDGSGLVREVWLSLPGVPQGGDSIPLGTPSVADALAGRAAGPFGMVRFNEPDPAAPRIREVWRSTGGYVKLTNVVQTGPAALCGWVSGRYEFTADGTDVATGNSLGTTTVSGRFETRATVLPPSDSLVDPARAATASRQRELAVLMVPQRASGRKPCDF